MKKMIVHAMRYALFGKQILTKGKIEDYTEANPLYYQVMNDDLEKYEDWKPIEAIYKPLHEKLLDEAFPRTLASDDFLDKNEATEIAELKRIREFRGSFDGQARIAILDIIRKEIMEPGDFHDEFPDFADQFDDLQLRFEGLCKEIQQIYDEIDHMDLKTESKELADAIKTRGKKYEGIIFFMFKEKCSKSKELFKTNSKRKFLYTALFSNKES